jgi:hypothetical protein
MQLVILSYSLGSIFINVHSLSMYIVLFLFNNVIYVFFIAMTMYSQCMFMYGYPD